jgi:hypothetical protein
VCTYRYSIHASHRDPAFCCSHHLAHQLTTNSSVCSMTLDTNCGEQKEVVPVLLVNEIRKSRSADKMIK